MFFGFELLRLRFSPLRLLGAGAALALMLIAGHPQMFLVAVLALGVHALVLTLADLRSDRGRPLGLLMLMGLTALALAAIQLVPTAAILDATDRSALTYAQATAYSFPKTHLPLLGFPYLFGNNVLVAPFSAPYRGRAASPTCPATQDWRLCAWRRRVWGSSVATAASWACSSPLVSPSWSPRDQRRPSAASSTPCPSTARSAAGDGSSWWSTWS